MTRFGVRPLALLLWLGLLGCGASQVTLHGQVVTDETAQTAARTLDAAAQTLTVATGAIRAGYEQGMISRAKAQYFLEKVYRPGLAAILAGQDAVTAYLQTKNASTLEQVRTSLALVRYWLAEVQGLLSTPERA